MSRIIVLQFAFEYENQLLPGIERDPRIAFHLSSDAGHHMAVIDPYAERPLVRFEIEAPDDGEPFIAHDASLQVWQFVTQDNDSGEPSTNEAGYALFPLRELLSNRKSAQLAQELIVMNARNTRSGIDARKGVIALSVDKSSFPDGRSPFLAPSKYDITAENQDFIVDVLSNYIQSNNAIFQKKPSTYKSVQYLHLPLWSYGAYSVAGSAFGVPRAQPSPESWWRNASRIALRRHYQHLSLEEAEQRFLRDDTGEEEVMTVVSKMHTAVVNHVSTYLSDGVYVSTHQRSAAKFQPHETYSGVEGAFAEDICRSVGAKSIAKRRLEPALLVAGGAHANRDVQFVNMEAFTLGRMRVSENTAKGANNSGDCEDDAGEICLQAMELKTLKSADPVLAKMIRVRQNYMVLQVLMGVRGAQLSDSQKASMSDSAHAELGGHMAAMYISNEDFLRMHSRYNTSKPLYEGLAAEAPQVGARSRPLILEGTGLVDPVGDPEFSASVDAMRYLLQGSGNAFTRMKFIQPQSRSELNSFYRVVQSFVAVDLADNYSSIEHVVIKKDNGRTSTGADYLEFLNGDPRIATYSMPNMTEDEIRVTKSILKHRFPIVGYKEPSSAVSAKTPVNEHLRRVAEAVRATHRKVGDCWVVDFYPRYNQVDAALEQSWKQLVSNKQRIVDFEYYEENLGPNTGGYLARFYVAK